MTSRPANYIYHVLANLGSIEKYPVNQVKQRYVSTLKVLKYLENRYYRVQKKIKDLQYFSTPRYEENSEEIIFKGIVIIL